MVAWETVEGRLRAGSLQAKYYLSHKKTNIFTSSRQSHCAFMTPTLDQQNAIAKMTDFFAPVLGGEKFFLLSGYAGTGKTFTITKFVKNLPGDIRVILTAPTNKAVRVLEKMAMAAGLSVDTATICSLLGLVLDYNKDQQILKKKRQSSLNRYDLVFVDECSMVGAELWPHIQQAAEASKTRVIFVGDPLQLPPVNEPESPTFQITNRADLTQIIRQKDGNPIIEFSAAIRTIMTTGERLAISPFLSNPQTKAGVYLMPGPRFEKWFPAAFQSARYSADRDAFRVVSWTNKKVNYFNDRIRAFLVENPGPQPFVAAERAITAGAVHKKGKKDKMILALNADVEGEVLRCRQMFHPWHADEKLLVWETVFRPFDTKDEFTVFLPDPHNQHPIQNRLSTLANMAREGKTPWWEFWNLKNSLADLRPCHAITVHRSQGSTFNHVFVDSENILTNPNRQEALQCLYVAVTRAANTVILNSEII